MTTRGARELDEWRRRILDAVLLGFAVLGVVAYVPSVRLALEVGLLSVVVADTAILLLLFALLVLRRLPYGVRAGGLLAGHYGLSLLLLVVVGPLGAGPIWLFAFPIMTVLFFGVKAAVGAVALTTLTLVGIGAALPGGHLPWSGTPGGEPGLWIVLAANFLLLDTGVTISVGVLLEGLRQTARERTRLSRAVEQGMNPMALTDGDGAIEYVNHAFTEATGRGRDEVSGRTLVEVGCLGSGAGSGAEARRALREGRPWRGMVTNLRADESSYQADAFLYPVRDGGGSTYMVFGWRDVTRELSLEAQLLQAQKMEAVGTLAGGVAHDFNNLLVPMLGNLEVARERIPDPEVRMLVEEALDAAEQARALVRQLLVFSRRDVRERHPVHVTDLLADVQGILHALVPPGATLALEAPDTDLAIEADPVEVHQVMINLVANAAHALEEGSGVVTVEAHARTGPAVAPPPALDERTDGDTAEEWVELTVRDNGIGMAPEVAARVLEPFFTTKPVGQGSGLGLAVVYEIVRSLGGRLDIDTEPGGGTEVHVWIPRWRGDVPRRTVGERPALSSGEGRHVLVVDDEEAVLRTTGRILERLGYVVTTRLGGRAGVRAYLEDPHAFDLVFTDLAMPEVTGLELARAVHEEGRGTPVIVATGYLDSAARVGTAGSGVSRILQKPFEIETLSRALEEELATE